MIQTIDDLLMTIQDRRTGFPQLNTAGERSLENRVAVELANLADAVTLVAQLLSNGKSTRLT